MFNLSELALKMLNEGIRHESITKKDDIVKQLNTYGYPVFDIVVEFQNFFGGIEYTKGPNGGLILDIFQSSDDKTRKPIVCTVFDNICFECARFHDENEVSLFMDEYGYIYIRNIFGELDPSGESIVNQIEIDAIGELMKKECAQWITTFISNETFHSLLKKKEKGLYKVREYCSNYISVWTNQARTIYAISYGYDDHSNCGFHIYGETEKILSNFTSE
jgi:hypothetical protein